MIDRYSGGGEPASYFGREVRCSAPSIPGSSMAERPAVNRRI